MRTHSQEQNWSGQAKHATRLTGQEENRERELASNVAKAQTKTEEESGS